MKKKLIVLYGGKSAEHEVSISTAFSVIQALDFAKYEVHPIYIQKDGTWVRRDALEAPVENMEELRLETSQKASHPLQITAGLVSHVESDELPVVFPLLHGPNGEDGTVQGFLEVLNIPYVGNGVLASAAGMDKVIMKNIFAQAGLNQVNYVSFTRYEWDQDREGAYAKTEKVIGYPCFVKPANLGSSVGINKCKNRADLEAAFIEAFQYDRKIIIEEGVDGREIELALLGNDEPACSIPGEIIPKAEFYDYEAKYEDDSTDLVIPADIPEETYEMMKEMAITAFKALDCSGLIRADFFLKKNGEILINEVNTMPGFTPISMYPLLWQHTGISYPELIDRLIELGLERYKEKQSLRVSYK
ncbi:MAG: D-alanine--D-alanine ligase [Caldibacillus sp.]